jgi:hypothetical protein
MLRRNEISLRDEDERRSTMTERDFRQAPDDPSTFRPRGFTFPSTRIYKLTIGIATALSFLLFAVPRAVAARTSSTAPTTTTSSSVARATMP